MPLIWMRIAIAGVIAVFVAGFVWKFRHDSIELGRAEVRAEWEQDIAKRTAQALAASEAARVKETALQAAKQESEVRYANVKKTAAIAAANSASELGRLRDTISRAASASPRIGASASAGTDGDRVSELLGICAGEVQSLAGTADRLAGKVSGLQGYVLAACK